MAQPNCKLQEENEVISATLESKDGGFVETIEIKSGSKLCSELFDDDPDDEILSMEESNNGQENQSQSYLKILCFANLVKSTMGIGISGLAKIYCDTGILLGVVILIIAGMLSFWAQRIVVQWKVRYDATSLEDLAKKTLGWTGYVIIKIALAINIYSSLLCLFIFSGEFIFPLLQILQPGWVGHQQLFYKIFVSGVVICLSPVTLLRDLSILGFTSSLGMICMLILIITSGVGLSFEGTHHNNFIPSWGPTSGLWPMITNFGIALMANHGQHAICDIHECMRGKGSMKWPSIFATSIVTFLNVCLSLMVYTNIGDDQCADTSRIYVNFGLKNITASWLVATGTLSFCICIICTLPLYQFYLRRLVYDLFRDFMNGVFGKEFPNSQDMPLWFHIGFPGIVWFSGGLISVFSPKAMAILDFSGLLTCSCTMILLPTAMVLKEGWPLNSFSKIYYFMILMGFLIGVFFVGRSFYDLTV